MSILLLEYVSFVMPLQNASEKDIEDQSSLLEEYHLRNGGSPATYLYSHGFTENSHFPAGKEVTLESYFYFL